jgi:hypothetical protein
LLPRTDEMSKGYKNPDNDPRGALGHLEIAMLKHLILKIFIYNNYTYLDVK